LPNFDRSFPQPPLTSSLFTRILPQFILLFES
jgi:hypothetical protein